MAAVPVLRAPMRARTLQLDPFAGARHGVERGLVGIGDPLPRAPRSLDDAVQLAIDAHGAKAGRMLDGFAALPAGTLVWTRTDAGAFHAGEIAGPWRYDDSPAALAVGLVHVRACRWEPSCAVPDAVARAFARGGRNLQRIRALSPA